MTKKHFEDIAQAVKDLRKELPADNHAVDRFSYEIALVYYRENSNFNPSHFLEACGTKERKSPDA
jgi:hypothetical protein